MKYAGFVLAAALCLAPAGSRAGVLVTRDDIMNGASNLTNPLFGEALGTGAGIDAAVNFLIAGDAASGTIARTSLIRTITAAHDSLPGARGYTDDAASRFLYDAMIVYDLLSSSGVMTAAETSRLREYMKEIIDRYLDPSFQNWSDPHNSLGANAMRIAACTALYALNFTGDIDSGRYLSYARRILEQNLRDAIDDGGAWVAGDTGDAVAALDAIIMSIRAFRNAGIFDFFGNARLAALMRGFGMLLPPLQSNFTGGSILAAGPGIADPGVNPGAVSILAAADILSFSPDTASDVMWQWNRCGSPVTPLGVLFIHPDMEARPPVDVSMTPGGGTAIFRDRFGEPRESMLFADFGPAYGTPDHDYTRQIAAGDFSFIWRGIPLIVQGYSPGRTTRDLVTRREWRHNLVLNDSAGDTPVLPEEMYAEPDISPREPVEMPGDLFPGGLSAFLTSGLVDYAAGPLRLSDGTLPAENRYRHILFLKPDALFVWDQVESSFPVEWNLWMPVENAYAEGNVLSVHTTDDVTLEAHFAGDSTVNYSVEEPPEAMMWDWPLVMRAGHGAGSIMFTTLDLFGAAADTVTFARDLFHNMLMDGGEPAPVGVITGTARADSLLSAFGIQYERIAPEAVSQNGLRRFRTLVIGDFGATSLERVIHDSGQVISDYIRDGGRAILVCREPGKWRFPPLEGPAFPPVPLEITDRQVVLDPATFRPNMYPDSLWARPNLISNTGWLDWVSGDSLAVETGAMGLTAAPLPVQPRTFFVPGTWSDAWQVLASAYTAVPVDTAASPAGAQSRIRVKHPRSRDFKALLLPRRIGEPYLFDVRRLDDNMIVFAEPNRTWTITTGGADWTDALLSVRIESAESTELYAFECTHIRVGDDDIRFDTPLSIYYSGLENGGVIATPRTNTLYYQMREIRMHAGEIRFSDLFGNISLDRQTYVTTLRISDQNGRAIPWADIYQDGRFVGATDEQGMIPLRWMQNPPEIRVSYDGVQAIRRLAPGDMQVMLSLQ